MSKYPGRILRATAPTVTVDEAKGIWTVDEALQYKQAGTWPEQILPDPYFNQTTLLLHGDGTNGAQNNTFVDSSSNALSISREGNPTQGTFSPFSVADGEWSNYFDGNGDYLTTPVSANLGLGSSDFCIEWWEFRQRSNDYNAVLGGNTSYVALYDPIIWSESGNVVVYLSSSAGSWDTLSGFNLGSIDVGQWVHFCLTKSGSVFRGFKNGVLTSTVTTNNTVYMSANSWRIGYAQNRGGADTFQGYISNLRMSIGSIPTNYQTSSTTPTESIFTPSTSPLTASSQGAISSDVELLTCQSNRFVDNSSNEFTLTPFGNTAVKSLSPFAETDTTTGSGYFDGTGDYFVVGGSGTSAQLGTGDFCAEAWFYSGSTGIQQYVFNNFTGAGSGDTQWAMNDTSTGFRFQGWNTVFLTGATRPPRNQWNHAVVCRESGRTSLFINGVREATSTSTFNLTAPTNEIRVGAHTTGTSPFNGYISQTRLVKGDSVYDPAQTTLTVPTSPATSDANTELLTCQYRGTVRNVGFIDSSPNKFLITRNGSTTQGTFSPFSSEDGKWSNYFPAGTDYLTTTTTNTGIAGEFTIEFWMYLTSSTGTDFVVLWNNSRWIQFANGALYATLAGFSGLDIGGLNKNEWVHICITRDASNNTYAFKNGELKGTSTSTLTFFNSTFRIGQYSNTTRTFAGYLSNMRVVDGDCLHTTTFTPSTTPLEAISGTVLLACQGNRFVDASGTHTIATTGVPSVQPFSPFAPSAAYSASTNGGSGYFDGTGDYLSIANNAAFNLGTNDFCIDGWFYPTSTNATQLVFNKWGTVSDAQSMFQIGRLSSVFWSQLRTTGGYINFTTSTWILNAWNYFVVVRDGSTISAYLNGVRFGTDTSNPTLNTGTETMTIGSKQAQDYFAGYISGCRIVNGSPVYDPTQTTLTIPTAPSTAITDTQFITSFTNAGIFDNTAKNNLETVGNAQVDTSVVKYGTGSMKFDGTGDWLVCSNLELSKLGSSDFTIEAWANFTTLSAIHCIVGQTAGSQTVNQFMLTAYASGLMRFWLYRSGTYTTLDSPTGAVTTGTWYHIAVVRNGSTFTMYIDGTSVGTLTESAPLTTPTGLMTVGAASTGGLYPMIGYVDDLRITREARYTSNFTVPDAPFPDQ